LSLLSVFFVLLTPHPISTLFPYTTLFRSNDMARVWKSLRRVTVPGGRVCFVVGDSAPYGVYVPVDRWLGDLAIAAGFESYRFERSEEHTSELQSPDQLVCRLLLEKKKEKI